MWTLAILLGCSTSHDRYADGATSPPANAEQFCREQSMWRCRRAADRGEIDSETESNCLSNVDLDCRGAEWSCDEIPTVAQADACIEALASPSRVSEPSGSLPECIGLCDAVFGR